MSGIHNNQHERWEDQLSDYMDADLPDDDRAALEAHLAECGDCRDALAELREVVAAAQALGDLEPAQDLWPGIAAAIAAPIKATGRTVIPLPTAHVAEREPGGVFLSRPQMAAAASILIIVSAAATWIAGPGLAVHAPGLSQTAVTAPARFAADLPDMPVALAEELSTLEAALTDAGPRLDPETVRIIEKNLIVIERAIEDSQQALAREPENAFLTEHLDRAYERKLSFLQSTMRVLEWAG